MEVRQGRPLPMSCPHCLHFILKARPDSSSETEYARPQLWQVKRTGFLQPRHPIGYRPTTRIPDSLPTPSHLVLPCAPLG